LCCPQCAFRIGQIAIFDSQGNVPQLFDDAGERLDVVIAFEAPKSRSQAQENDLVSHELVWCDCQSVQRQCDIVTILAAADQISPLFDHGASQRLCESAGW